MPRPKKVVAPAQPVLTPDELDAILAIRSQKAVIASGGSETQTAEPSVAVSELAKALILAIETTRPPTKKTVASRKSGKPYDHADGSSRLKLKRPCFQHGIEIDIDTIPDEAVERLNQLRPGTYCSGWIKVTKRRDGTGLDIAYPVRTAAQRLKLPSYFVGCAGVTPFSQLLARLLDEKSNPAKYRLPEDEDDD